MGTEAGGAECLKHLTQDPAGFASVSSLWPPPRVCVCLGCRVRICRRVEDSLLLLRCHRSLSGTVLGCFAAWLSCD